MENVKNFNIVRLVTNPNLFSKFKFEYSTGCSDGSRKWYLTYKKL